MVNRQALAIAFVGATILGAGSASSLTIKRDKGAVAYGFGFAATYYDSLGSELQLQSNVAIRPAFATSFLWEQEGGYGLGPLLVVDTAIDFSDSDSLSISVGNIGVALMVAFRESRDGDKPMRGVGIGLAYSISNKVPAKGADGISAVATGHAVQAILIFSFGKKPVALR